MSSFDASPDAYVLREEIGRSETNGSSVVWLASASEHDADVAIKIQDLEKTTSTDLSRTQQDIQRMKELSHPNLAQLHAAFVARGELWLVLQLHAGSCQDIMRSRFPTGLEEQCVTCILRFPLFRDHHPNFKPYGPNLSSRYSEYGFNYVVESYRVSSR